MLLGLEEQAKAGNLPMQGFRAGLDTFGEIDGRLLGVPVGSNSMARTTVAVVWFDLRAVRAGRSGGPAVRRSGPSGCSRCSGGGRAAARGDTVAARCVLLGDRMP